MSQLKRLVVPALDPKVPFWQQTTKAQCEALSRSEFCREERRSRVTDDDIRAARQAEQEEKALAEEYAASAPAREAEAREIAAKVEAKRHANIVKAEKAARVAAAEGRQNMLFGD